MAADRLCTPKEWCAMSEVLHLKRTLSLGQLVVMGVIFVQPTAPMPPFGAIHVVFN